MTTILSSRRSRLSRRSSRRSFCLSCCLPVLLLLATRQAEAATVFYDTFDYIAWNSETKPMNAVWRQNPTTGAPSIITETPTSAPLLAAPYISLTDRVISANLEQPLATDFTLTVNAQHTASGRAFWVALINPEGTGGYGFRWDSSSSGSTGSLRVIKLNVSDASNFVYSGSFGATGTIGSFLDGTIGRPGKTRADLGADTPFVTVQLSWSNATSTLSLSIGDTVVGTYTDSTFSKFSSLYIGAYGANAMIADVTVTGTAVIPEPASAALVLALAGCCFLFTIRQQLRRRQ
jgi:hypothetical protein